MNVVFADTFYFLALLNPSDRAHAKAVAFTDGPPFRMVMTEWVVVELGDALAKSPRGRSEFLLTLADLRTGPDVVIVSSGPELLEQGIQLYANRLDKSWSLTDCISFVVMDKEGIREALTGDKHFEQAGFIALLK